MFRRSGGSADGIWPGRWSGLLVVPVLGLAAALAILPWGEGSSAAGQGKQLDGQEIFRFDTFGDEQLWTDRLGLHEVIESSIDPVTALQLGLKVDVDALPPEVITALQQGAVDLTDPAVTVALIKLNAVVGVVGTVEPIDGRDRLTKVGITCAICHSTVDNSFAPGSGIGSRLDGWANVDLDPGRIIAASPNVPLAAKEVYLSWGPGKYDPIGIKLSKSPTSSRR
jgi:hypothetical protein